MTAKELRRQAEYIVEQWDNHDKFRMVEGDAAFMNADGEPDAVTFARHILSTVRDDDDEPVTEEWAKSIGGKYNIHNDGYEIGKTLLWLFHIKEWHCDLWRCNLGALLGRAGDIKTRGQFRSLCRGLGIELKEEKTC